MIKPDGFVDTYFLNEIRDNPVQNKLWGFLKDCYGICESDCSIDERTGEIIKEEWD
jgi:hypothetical protein